MRDVYLRLFILKREFDAMLRTFGQGLLICSLLLSVSANDGGFSRCNCDDEGLWVIESILQCQKVSDFFIALSYFSIPLELLYFVTCSNLFPFKWVLVQFGAFIVLCGLTHLLNVWTYGPHSFTLMLSLTVFKLLTAFVSCATAITLITLIPQLLRIKVREVFLKEKTRELDREVGKMKRQEEASWHVRMLTKEIRKSLDRHTILYTTLVELSKTLVLANCAVWMPSDEKTELVLTHELNRSNSNVSIPITDLDVMDITGNKGVKILGAESRLGSLSSFRITEPGSVAAIRMPMLRVSNFKGGTPEMIQACYAILVLVLPGEESRVWSYHEMEIIEVVADQVAVALSHAAVLEESQLMREKLADQNRALQQAKENAMMASEARNAFQKVMSHGMRRPMYSISGLLSMIQQENLKLEQRIIIDTMVKTSSVLSTLINDAMEISNVDHASLSLKLKSFSLHFMIKEAACLARCLSACKGYGFRIDVENGMPNWVIGDETRIFQLILHMVGNLLNCYDRGVIKFRVYTENENENRRDHIWLPWKPNPYDGYTYVKFEIGSSSSQVQSSSFLIHPARRSNSEGVREGLSFTMCKRLVQMMQGNIWVVPDSQGLGETMTLVLRFQPQSSPLTHDAGSSSEFIHCNSRFTGLKILVADDDGVNRAVTRKMLEKLGFRVFAVSSGFDCLSTLSLAGNTFQIVLLDLHMPELDGFEVATRIRKFRSGNWPLIVALTASADEDVCERCMQIGMNGMIRKPVLLKGMEEELLRVLKQVSQGS